MVDLWNLSGIRLKNVRQLMHDNIIREDFRKQTIHDSSPVDFRRVEETFRLRLSTYDG